MPNADPPRHGALSLRRELTRKALHLLSTAVPLAYWLGLGRAVIAIVLAFALATALVVEIARARHEQTRAAFDARVGQLLRGHEARGLSGATWLVTALLVATLLFPRDVAIASMASVTVGDAAAAIAGRTLSRRRGEGKSLAGSVSCFAASAFMVWAIADFTWPDALIVGLLAAIAERPRRPLDDNLRIALVVGCGILLWRMGFS